MARVVANFEDVREVKVAARVMPDTVMPTVVIAAVSLAAGALWALLLAGPALLDEPVSVPGSMAAGLLLAASYPAWSLSRHDDASALLFPGVLLLVSFSELLALHHDVEDVSRIDWQVFYLPVLLVALAIGWRMVGHRTGKPLLDRFLQAAFLGWIAALLLEAAQWRLIEGETLHSQLGGLKDGIEVVSAGALFLALSLVDRAVHGRS